ncbi:MAG: DUF123 domain-containing protein [Candidatus Thorarchaeota archaeon]
MMGVYSLIIYIPERLSIKVGARQEETFDDGYWVYIGSAQGKGSTTIENRLRRHFRREKKMHWHIDYLLDSNVTLLDAIWSESKENQECKLIEQLLATHRFSLGPRSFGAGDCKQGCGSHILRVNDGKNPSKRIEACFERLGLAPKVYAQIDNTRAITQ